MAKLRFLGRLDRKPGIFFIFSYNGCVDLGSRLREARKKTGQSHSAVARAAGIARSTLVRWETGKTLPRTLELESVLTVLEVTGTDRQRFFDSIPCTRFVAYQVDSTTAHHSGSPHQLLRAMRLRKGSSQDDVSSHLGVSKAAVSQWERGEAWPSAEHLHALCFYMDAAPEEVMALSRGPARLGQGTHSSLESFEDHVWGGARPLLRSTPNPLLDLEAISLESEAALLARRESMPGAAHEVLGEIRATYSQALLMWGRATEAKQCVRRALDIPRGTEPTWFFYRAKVVDAQASMATGASFGRQQITSLRSLLDPPAAANRLVAGSCRTWIILTLASAAAKLHQEAETFGYADMAWKSAVDSDCCNNELFRWTAKLLNQFGRHREALRCVEDGLAQSKPAEYRVGLKMEAVRAGIGLAEPSLAQEWLRLAEQDANERNLAVYSRELAQLRASII